MVNHCIRKGVLIAGVIAVSLMAATSTFADNYKPKRTADGKPDFNGVWQTTGRANYDIEPHSASAAMALREGPFVPVPAKEVVALGAVGSVPASLGIVEGDKIPYKPEALKQRDANKENWLKADPEVKCYLPGIPRATYMPYQFQVFQNKASLPASYPAHLCTEQAYKHQIDLYLRRKVLYSMTFLPQSQILYPRQSLHLDRQLC